MSHGIELSIGFDLKSKDWNFTRDSFETIQELNAYNKNYIPDGFITYVKGEKCRYQLKDNVWVKLNYEELIQGLQSKITALETRVEELEKNPPALIDDSNFISSDPSIIVTSDSVKKIFALQNVRSVLDR